MDAFLQNWKEIAIGVIVPTVTNAIIFFKWMLPYIRKCQQVQKLIDVNTLMEVFTPFLEEIDNRLQIMARSSTTLAESQKIIANEIGTLSSLLNTINNSTFETNINKEKNDSY